MTPLRLFAILFLSWAGLSALTIHVLAQLAAEAFR